MNWSLVSNQEAKSCFLDEPRLETPQLFSNTWQRGSCGQTKTEAKHNHDYGRRNPSYHEIFFGVDKVISHSHSCASAQLLSFTANYYALCTNYKAGCYFNEVISLNYRYYHLHLSLCGHYLRLRDFVVQHTV